MQTKEQVTHAFKAELQALLDKYGAELEAKDFWQGYAECGEDVRMEVTVPAIYDADHNCVREWTDIDLGAHIWPTPNAEVSGCLRAPMPEDAPRTAAGSPLDRPVGPVAGA